MKCKIIVYILNMSYSEKLYLNGEVTKSWFNLVELVTVDNEDLAYHYASDNVDEVFNQEKKFNELTKNISLSFSSHIIATKEASFDSLCKKDPYFKQFTSYQNLESFMEKVKEKSLLTDEEVAGYLRT